jgi:IclR family transcriptional regulator, KDG regulon repressor
MKPAASSTPGPGRATASPHRVQSVERAAHLLEALGASPRGLSLTEVSRAAGLHKSTARRILVTLMTAGFVRQASAEEHYTLGPRLIALSQTAPAHLLPGALVHPVLVGLRDELNETVHLAIPDGFELVYLEKVESRQHLRIASKVGTRITLYCTALGQAYLAHMPGEWVSDYLSVTKLVRKTANTITSGPLLLAKLEEARRRGFAFDDIENEDDIRCVAAPVLTAGGAPAAAISLTAPASRLTDELVPAYGSMIADAAGRISSMIGAG